MVAANGDAAAAALITNKHDGEEEEEEDPSSLQRSQDKEDDAEVEVVEDESNGRSASGKVPSMTNTDEKEWLAIDDIVEDDCF